MGVDLAAWPDVHDVLFALFQDLADRVVGPKRPPEYQDQIPLVRVRRLGGADDRITDVARVDVDVYASTYPASRDLATALQQRLLAAPHITPAGRIDTVETEVGPREIPHDDQAVRLVAATYRISFRR